MVNRQESKSIFSASKIHYKLADIYDRMAAFVVDFALILFCHSFLSFSIKAKQNQAFLEGFNISFAYWFCLNLLLFILLFFSYNFFSLKYYKKTLGKKIFHIRTLSIWTGADLDNEQIYKYSLWKSLSLLLFGIPLLGTFFDKRKRAFHEKMADVAAYTTKNRYHSLVNQNESNFYKGMLLPIQISFVAFVVFTIFEAGKEIKEYENLSVLDMHLQAKCEELDIYLEEASASNRLEAAISLYLIDQVDSECLEVEAQANLEDKENLSLSYLALSFVRPEKSSEYKELVCKSEKWQSYCSNTKKTAVSDLDLFLKINKSLENKKYKKTLNYVSALKGSPFFKYLEPIKLKALYYLNSESKIVFALKNMKNSIKSEVYHKVTAMLCEESISKSCQTSHYACNELASIKDFNGLSRKVKIAYIDLRICNDDKGTLPLGIDESLQDYYYALWQKSKKQQTKDIEKILHSKSYPAEIRNAALRHIEIKKDLRFPASEDN